MNVLVIPEDFRNDQYLLKPLFKRLFATLGRRHARIRVCQDPLLGGVGEALKAERIREVVDQHRGMTDIFVLCVDRDGEAERRTRLTEIEGMFASHCKFLAENAWEEIETWALAGLALPGEWSWQQVRAEVRVKERYFEPLAKQRGVDNGPGGGRKALGEEAARNIDTIRRKCPEDFGALAGRLRAASELPWRGRHGEAPSVAPRHEVVRLRADMRTGELSLADFAADLHDAVMGKGVRLVYEDPGRFFALNLSDLPPAGARARCRTPARRPKHQGHPPARAHLRRGQDPCAGDAAPPRARPGIAAGGRPVPVPYRRAPAGGGIAALCFDKLDVEKGMRRPAGAAFQRPVEAVPVLLNGAAPGSP